eukprot:1983570-Rhodomonas_salina.3
MYNVDEVPATRVAKNTSEKAMPLSSNWTTACDRPSRPAIHHTLCQYRTVNTKADRGMLPDSHPDSIHVVSPMLMTTSGANRPKFSPVIDKDGGGHIDDAREGSTDGVTFSAWGWSYSKRVVGLWQVLPK